MDFEPLDSVEGVELEEGHTQIMHLEKPIKSVMIEWLVNHKIAHSEKEAKFLLVALSLLALSLSILVLYFGSLYVTPESNSPTTVTSPYTNSNSQ